jgi:hypothetical protein
MLRTALFTTFIASCTIYLFLTGLPEFTKPYLPITLIDIMTTETSYAGWHGRAQPHPSPDSYTYSRDKLAITVLQNAQVETEGFTLALFNDKVAVDASGNVLVVDDKDYEGIIDLSKKILELPKTENFRNTWRLKVSRTSQPNDRILVHTGGEVVETGVQGYAPDRTELSSPEGEIPTSLKTLAGLVLEAREGYKRGEAGPAVDKVKELVRDLF